MLTTRTPPRRRWRARRRLASWISRLATWAKAAAGVAGGVGGQRPQLGVLQVEQQRPVAAAEAQQRLAQQLGRREVDHRGEEHRRGAARLDVEGRLGREVVGRLGELGLEVVERLVGERRRRAARSGRARCAARGRRRR